MTRRQSGPAKTYPLRQHEAWKFLENKKGWKYVNHGGEFKVDGPGGGDAPMLQIDVRKLPCTQGC